MGLKLLVPGSADERVAREMADVGIVPWAMRRAIGSTFEMAGQRFSVTGYATREEFIAAALAYMPDRDWDDVPNWMHYLRVSTD